MSPLRRFQSLKSSDPEFVANEVRSRYSDIQSFTVHVCDAWSADERYLSLGASGVVAVSASPHSLAYGPSGNVRVMVGAEGPFTMRRGAEAREFRPHSAGLAPGGESHCDFDAPSSAIIFHCPGAELRETLEQLEGRLSIDELQNGFFGSGMLPLRSFQLQLTATIRAFDENPAALISAHRFKAAQQELLTLALAQCLTARSGVSRSPMGRSVFLARALDYIQAHYAQDFRWSTLASAAGCSLRTLQSLFRSELDATPTSYLTSVRLREARRRLGDNEQQASVASIALQTGFAHLGEFARAYHREFNESPAQTASGSPDASTFSRSTASVATVQIPLPAEHLR
ncbi:MAG: AraC family transcriptional regulator [Hyphomicrobiales bacterium]|nr:AraC family transcriptional regulator [Hyphomicrobiales bacterium]